MDGMQSSRNPLPSPHGSLTTSSTRFLVALPSVEKLRHSLEADRKRIESLMALPKSKTQNQQSSIVNPLSSPSQNLPLIHPKLCNFSF